jgi:hypothetical protein
MKVKMRRRRDFIIIQKSTTTIIPWRRNPFTFVMIIFCHIIQLSMMDSILGASFLTRKQQSVFDGRHCILSAHAGVEPIYDDSPSPCCC